jgi:hypothetical protein
MFVFDRAKPTVAVLNLSDAASNRQVARMVTAIQKQLDEHFSPAWGLKARLLFNEQPRRAMRVFIKDTATKEDTGLLGYHFIDGLPATYVFARDDLKENGEFSSTLSHEILEMLADPGANLYADGFVRDKLGRKRLAMISYEVCDPVEASTYKVDGVPVSNFVLPEWFEPEHEDGALKMDFCKLVDGPFQLAEGGYIDYLRNGKLLTVWGPKGRRKKTRHRLARRISNQSLI